MLLAFFAFLIALASFDASGQTEPPAVEWANMAGLLRIERDLEMMDDLLLGLRVGYRPMPHYGAELAVDYLSSERRGHADEARDLYLFGLRGMLQPWPQRTLSPFVGLGSGITRLDWGGQRRWNSLTGFAVAGLYARLGYRLALRLETQLGVGSFGGDLRQNFGFQLGISSFIGRDGDGDLDGIPDSRDHCPATPRGVLVDPHGCPLPEGEEAAS